MWDEFHTAVTNNNNALRDATRFKVGENYERFGAPRCVRL